MHGRGGGGGGAGGAASEVLEEEIDENYKPGDKEIEEYAQWLGMARPPPTPQSLRARGGGRVARAGGGAELAHAPRGRVVMHMLTSNLCAHAARQPTAFSSRRRGRIALALSAAAPDVSAIGRAHVGRCAAHMRSALPDRFSCSRSHTHRGSQDMVADQDLFWVAEEGLKAPLPPEWKPCPSPPAKHQWQRRPAPPSAAVSAAVSAARTRQYVSGLDVTMAGRGRARPRREP